jgi:hypothetical protein
MDRGIRPIDRTRNVSMPHRVVMDVVEMPLEIDVVTDQMFPKPSLPDRRFAMLACGRTTQIRMKRGIRRKTRDGTFDQRPARGKIGVALGQSLDTVQMIRHRYPDLDRTP